MSSHQYPWTRKTGFTAPPENLVRVAEKFTSKAHLLRWLRENPGAWLTIIRHDWGSENARILYRTRPLLAVQSNGFACESSTIAGAKSWCYIDKASEFSPMPHRGEFRINLTDAGESGPGMVYLVELPG